MKSTQCEWLEDGSVCLNHAIKSKSYCEHHYRRAYSTVPTKMADYILEKEIRSSNDINFSVKRN